MHDFSKNKPLGGLDSDSENRVIDPLSYRYAKNVRNAINAAGRGGTLTNVKGNLEITKYCLPYSNHVFPTGTNRVIGSVEDTKYSTVVYFVWNSKGLHQILRYYRNVTSPANPYGEVRQVIQYNFGWSRTTRINSGNIVYGVSETGAETEETGDLLYWCDPIPKKINLTKGEVCGKIKCWDLYVPLTVSNFPSTLLLEFKNFSGAVIDSINIVMPPPPDVPPCVDTTITALVGFLAPNQIYTSAIIPGIAPGFVFTISGSSVVANDKQYTVVSVVVNSTGMQITVAETVVFADLSTCDIEYLYCPPAPPDTRGQELFITTIAAAINANPALSVTADPCACHLEICERVAGTVWTISANTNAVRIPASNWYGATLIDRFFDRCKWPPLNPPIGTFGADVNLTSNILPNYVQRKIFQFRLEYGYDDLERSALGVWSKITIDNLQCDGTPNVSLNFIDVDFNDSLISTETALVILKKVRFIARQLNTGQDRAVIELKPCDFLDYDGTNWFCHFKFYNNIISNAIDSATAAKLFDNVPLESNDERFVKNRLVEGGILEGYDAPECPVADFTIQILESKNKLRHKVSGRIRILTYGLAKERGSSGAIDGFTDFYAADKKYPFWKPPYVGNMQPPPAIFQVPYRGAPLLRGGIFNDTSGTAGAFFGGGSYSGSSNNVFGITSGMETDFDQRIPEGGFTVYAAGEQNFTISKQININCAVDTVGALDISSQLKVDRIGQYLFNQNDVPFDLYSTFELDLPDGVHVIRLASHWCSNNDVLNKGFAYDLKNGLLYQKTSTNVHSVIDSAGNWLLQKEITVTVSGGDVYIGEFVVMDVAPPIGYDSNSWQSICGYLYDDNGVTNPNDPDYAGIPVEKSIVFYGFGYVWQDNGGTIFGAGTELGVHYSNSCATDANGYFFGIGGTHCLPSSPPQEIAESNNMQVFATNSLGKLRAVDTTLCVGTLSNFLDKTLQIIDFNGNNVNYGIGTIFCIVTTNNIQSRTSAITVQGYVKDQNGIGVYNVLTVYQEGANTQTNASGFYRFIAWCDAVESNKGSFSSAALAGYNLGYGRTIDDLVFNASAFCEVTYPNGQTYNFSLTDTHGGGLINNLPDFIINEIANGLNVKTRKRGGKYMDGIRYYDNAGRLCSVSKLFEIYIPFETEDLSQYPYVVDAAGNPYPVGTYIGGVPIISWTINYTPPSWASFYQFMRTKNLIYGKYLQWVGNAVTYLSRVATAGTPEIVTSFQNGDATAIKISLSNIVDYSAANNDSLVGYAYQAGGRMRLMYDRGINLIAGFNEFEVTSYDATTQSILIKPGTYNQEILSGQLLEIYNPKSVETADQQILFEVGECYKVVGGQHSTTSGTFSNGDTYWRGRAILVNDTTANFSQSVNVVIEDSSESDFFSSDAQDIGRIGIIDPAFKQVYAPTKMRCSNAFLPSTAINGLSSFEELNQVELDRSNGQIERILQKENTIIAVTSLREVSTYVEVVNLQQADVGGAVLAIANQYFGTQYPHAKRLGTDLPSSVIINDGVAFGFQSKRGESWRYQGDGEVTISEAKMINYFQQLQQDGVSDATAVYNRYTEEYILTIWRNYQQRTTVYSVGGGTITAMFTNAVLPISGTEVTVQYLVDGVWNNAIGTIALVGSTWRITVAGVFTAGQQVNIVYAVPETVSFFNGQNGVTKERWMSFYSFTPECYSQLGSEVVMFKDGKLWLDGVNPLYNNFFGQQFNMEIQPVFNKEPESLKVWNSVTLQQLQGDGNNNWSAPTITNDNGQLSRINNAGFVKKGEIYYAPFKKDMNDVSIVPQSLAITQGRALRSTSLVCLLQNDSVFEVRLYGWDGQFTLSQRTNK